MHDLHLDFTHETHHPPTDRLATRNVEQIRELGSPSCHVVSVEKHPNTGKSANNASGILGYVLVRFRDGKTQDARRSVSLVLSNEFVYWLVVDSCVSTSRNGRSPNELFSNLELNSWRRQEKARGRWVRPVINDVWDMDRCVNI